MNTSEAAAYKKAEARFQAAVEKHLREGWQINAATMSGTQGEQAKVDFRKAGTIHRITLEQKWMPDPDDEHGPWINAWTTNEFTHRAKKSDDGLPYAHRTLWEQEATHRQEEIFAY